MPGGFGFSPGVGSSGVPCSAAGHGFHGVEAGVSLGCVDGAAGTEVDGSPDGSPDGIGEGDAPWFGADGSGDTDGPPAPEGIGETAPGVTTDGCGKGAAVVVSACFVSGCGCKSPAFADEAGCAPSFVLWALAVVPQNIAMAKVKAINRLLLATSCFLGAVVVVSRLRKLICIESLSKN
jgi:hypothetical protein